MLPIARLMQSLQIRMMKRQRGKFDYEKYTSSGLEVWAKAVGQQSSTMREAIHRINIRI